MFYKTVLGVHKIVVSGKLDNLSKKFSIDHPYRTRQATGGGLRFGEDYDAKSGASHSSFCYRGTVEYNRNPVFIRDAIIKENPVKSGFLQIRGEGSRGPPDPDFYM